MTDDAVRLLQQAVESLGRIERRLEEIEGAVMLLNDVQADLSSMKVDVQDILLEKG